MSDSAHSAQSTATVPPTKAQPAPGGATPAADRHVGVVGLAVMGENLALNIERNGFKIAVYNRTPTRTEDFLAERAAGKQIDGAFNVADFVAALAPPRRVLMMVKAGAPVDAVIAELLPYLQPGDILIDGGNSFFQDTERRSKELAAKGINFVGMGVSGGEEGALWGPSLMPGGQKVAYDHLEPMLTAIAAKTEAGPCVTYIGPGGSGHYVKMVHNGIEYGDMQLIAETYDIMRRALKMGADEMAQVFGEWNQSKLESYLIEITAAVLSYKDAQTGKPLVDLILDEAEQKGTGRWTAQNALELGVPIPTIDAAVWARQISALKEQRVEASKVLHGPGQDGQPALITPGELDKDRLLKALAAGLYVAKISSYAQGFALLRVASETYEWNLNLSEIARIWKGGCIIRAKLLDPIRQAFQDDPQLVNLLLAPSFTDAVNEGLDQLRHAIRVARAFGIPCPAFSASLDYIDSYREARLPANLIQGLRDFFGAHTYHRIDEPGTFHTVWEPPETAKSEPSHRQTWAEGAGEGERSPHPAHTPAAAEPKLTAPTDGSQQHPDAEEEGERSPESTKKAEY